MMRLPVLVLEGVALVAPDVETLSEPRRVPNEPRPIRHVRVLLRSRELLDVHLRVPSFLLHNTRRAHAQ
eukprot:2003339-Heterocapsa_arctica.AAC.1